jgi:SSS family solute:Na+ symporter
MFTEIFQERPELLTVPGLTASGEPWSWGGYSTSILISAVGVAMWPHLFMKAFTAKDDNTIRRTVVLFPTFQLFLIPVFLIGFAGVLFPESPPEPDFILPFMILQSDLPALVVGLFCAGALSASMSTGDALMHAGASVAVEDGVRLFKELDDAQQRRLMRGIVVGMGAVAYFFALYEGVSLVVLLLSSYGIIAQFTPPLVSALYWKGATTQGVVAGLVTGSLVTLFFFFNPELKPLDLHEGILGLLVHVPVLLAVSALTRDPAQEKAETFLEVARGKGESKA